MIIKKLVALGSLEQRVTFSLHFLSYQTEKPVDNGFQEHQKRKSHNIIGKEKKIHMWVLFYNLYKAT